MSFYPLRKTDVGLVLTVLAILGSLWAGYARTATWDQATRDVADIKPRIRIVEEQLIEYRAANTAQMGLIIRELDGIHREIKRR